MVWDGWWSVLLYCLGAPMNGHNKKFLLAWAQAEGGKAKYNPLNTTLPWTGATNYNKAGVKSYPSRRAGNDATVKTILGTKYREIVTLLQRGDAPFEELADAVGASPWGTSAATIKKVLGV